MKYVPVLFLLFACFLCGCRSTYWTIVRDHATGQPVPDATMRVWGDDGSYSPDIQDCGLAVFERWPHRITVVADGYALVELVDEVPETVFLYREPTGSAERAARD